MEFICNLNKLGKFNGKLLDNNNLLVKLLYRQNYYFFLKQFDLTGNNFDLFFLNPHGQVN